MKGIIKYSPKRGRLTFGYSFYAGRMKPGSASRR
jgi:hypothetical protein